MQVGASSFPGSIGVIGGGTAGYFAALALKRAFPAVRVTLVESSDVPIIGVGEATTTLMPPFLHRQLGLDVVDMFRAVRPTFKLGIKFEWGPPDPPWFAFPFGDAWPVEASVHERDLRRQSLASLLMRDDRVPIVRGPDSSPLSLLPSVKFAYHLENRAFVAYLAQAARRAGIEHVDATIEQASLRDGATVAGLRTTDGRELRFDFHVDATGFRSLLLEKALGSRFSSYASSLFCDRAVVGTVARRGPIQPYTTAETMDAGWCWRIPVGDEDHRGYVHASRFADEERAIEEMRAKNHDLRDIGIVRFRSGRHEDFWIGNAVAVGNSYGFVEPLESTALHMVIVELAYLVEGLRRWAAAGEPDVGFAARASQRIARHWDGLRWFLAVHYRFNRRLDTPFWRAARGEVDVSGAAELLDRFRREGPWAADEASSFAGDGSAFPCHLGYMTLLLGQRADGSDRARGSTARSTWEEMSSRHEAVVARALTQSEGLEVLRSHPEMLERFVADPSSWCGREGDMAAQLVLAR